MRKLDRVLYDALPQKLVLKMARAKKVMRRWNEVVGEKLAEKSWPDNYEKGTLFVAAQGSEWAQEIRLMKDRILLKMNALANEPDLFADLRIGQRALPEKPPIKKNDKPQTPKPKQTIEQIRQKWDQRDHEEGT